MIGFGAIHAGTIRVRTLFPEGIGALLSAALLAGTPALATATTPAGAAATAPAIAAPDVATPPAKRPALRIALIEGLSGPFANAGAAVERNLQWAVERVNARGGVRLPDGNHPLELVSLDSKGSVEDSLSLMRAAIDRQALAIFQGNSSTVAFALSDAVDRHNARTPDRRVLFINYSAVSPQLTNEKCNLWHFRFDAHSDMRLRLLTDAIAQDRDLKKVWLVGQDYSFGQEVVRTARTMLAERRPDITIAGETLHPLGRIKDFLPYAQKIVASGAQAIVTGNWGNDLTLLVRAARDAGFQGRFYTFYGNALGVPGVLADAGVDRVVALSEWHPNVPGDASQAFYADFRRRFPNPADDYVHLRMQQAIEMLARAVEVARSDRALPVARALAGASWPENADGKRPTPSGVPAVWPARPGDPAPVQAGTMRASDHQFIQPLQLSLMVKAGTTDAPNDVEGSGYGFRTLKRYSADEAALPSRCVMPDWPAE